MRVPFWLNQKLRSRGGIVNLLTMPVGKENTQKIESKHINLWTGIKRLMRRTLCFSKTERMHDLVIGLFINRYEFGRLI